ncbi:DUF1534 domain-containing protein [Pseudomonas syringae pv. actinidiae]|nr:DUF1534 domain-containing protein [Pseudomonas syringae pv. actinidiae]AYL84300.1 DUF1534 domain-containing protein [Pseudomonas syringae pv. actinidiae str. Shaanxi_M228]
MSGTVVEIIVPHAQRGNAVRDAPRHKSAPRRRPQDRTQSVAR